MDQTQQNMIIGRDELILITGATGFIGSSLLADLIGRGFRNLRCLVRSADKAAKLQALLKDGVRLEMVSGNLLSKEDCEIAAKGASVVFHLAAGTGSKSFPDAYMNSVVTTRNLLESCSKGQSLRRFVSISSFAVYTNQNKKRWRLLDENCSIECHSELRGDAYCFAKVKQDELIAEYGKNYELPFVLIRPGYVYGPGKTAITGRVGIDTFGFFIHLGGSNLIPLTYVDNCAGAIALAGLIKGVEGQVFNVVDDDLISSRRFLGLYKRNVKKFRSLYLPHPISYILCYLWEWYSAYSQEQLDPAFNRRKWHSIWKKTYYSNGKLKSMLGWAPKISTAEGLRRYFDACHDGGENA
jgi:nucleoside-diphosphate-sugar epimerase